MLARTAIDLRTVADDYWAALLEVDPLFGLQTGDDRFDDRLPDPSPEGYEARRAVHRHALNEVRRLQSGAADRWDRLIVDTIEAISGPALEMIDLGLHRLAPIDQLWGPGTLLDQFATLQTVDTEDRAERYLARLAATAGYLDATGRLLLDEGQGATGPRLIVDRCIHQVDEILATRPEDSSALRPLPAEYDRARSKAEATLRDEVLPAYARYGETLRIYRRQARDGIGLSELPRGDEMYAVCIRQRTSAGLDPKELHQIGVSELQRIQEERLLLARRLGASDAAAAIDAYVATGEGMYTSREEILTTASDQVEQGWQRAKTFFRRLPAANCVVRAVDPSRENDVLEHYWPGTGDGGRQAIYYVNTARPQQRPRHSLAATTFHEANPGHHLQVSLTLGDRSRPALLRFASELSGLAVLEGWGLYAERLADEMGLYRDDYERLGMLELQALRAARLVVDTGIHAFSWPRQRVIDTLVETGLPMDRAIIETDRYIAMPAQALAYKVGQLEIEAARDREQRLLGSDFSLSEFHDRLLDLGPVPLAGFRRELMNEDLNEARGKPA